MNKKDKKYDAFSLFEELDNDLYYEIEYDTSPIPGAGKFVLKSQKIEAPVRDEVRDIFDRMRDIARGLRSLNFSSSKFYERKVQQENSRIFYEQGMFMKDFEDHYGKKITYSAYFPRYQMMGYDQLRTYFTWRTEVRNGCVEKTSLSYAFIYLYELLNHIGVENAKDGLEKLMFFWKEFRNYDNSIDKYVLKWLKDYHIYYELPWTFREFIEENNLVEHYPKLHGPVDNFELYCSVSKYDIRKSVFFSEDHMQLIKDCFAYTMSRLKEVFEAKGIDLEDTIFQPAKNMPMWEPFKGALFYPWLKQPDRRVVLSEKEIYICSQNKWTFNTALTTESGRQLAGYILKQMEAVLRKVTKYKYSITASLATVNPTVAAKLSNEGISPEKVIADAVIAFYREATKTVVKVDHAALEKIRQEALRTQEKLIVAQEEEWNFAAAMGQMNAKVVEEEKTAVVFDEDIPAQSGTKATASNLIQSGTIMQKNEQQKDALQRNIMQKDEQQKDALKNDILQSNQEKNDTLPGPWGELRFALSDTELRALTVLLNGDKSVKHFADEQGIMLEVLMDGINEKAMDFVGDSLFDDEFIIYDDYIEDVKEMVEGL